jgi:CheY-like chemotaxis protein
MEKNLKNVIVVGINKENMLMIDKMLQSFKCDIKNASNINELNDSLEKSPNLIIIDDQNTEFIKYLRKFPKYKLPKIILISMVRFSKTEKNKLTKDLNVVGFLPYPFELDEFEKKISYYL